MATINDLIDSARYDLRDYQTGLEFDDVELIEFVNRMIRNMDSSLIALNSDLVHGSASLSLGAGVTQLDISSTLNSGKWDTIRSLYRSRVKIYQLSVDDLYYNRLMTSGTGAPDYWALQGTTLQFDKTTDQIYTLTCWYNKTTGTLSGSSTTPYAGIVDDWLREMLVMHAKSKKEGNLGKPEMIYSELARKRAMEIQIRRSFVPKPYKIDF